MVEETSFTCNKGGSFFIFDHQASVVTSKNITLAFGSVSPKLCAQFLFSSIIF
jgi:hypothetical protein